MAKKFYIAYIDMNNVGHLEEANTIGHIAFKRAKDLVLSGKAIASYYNTDVNVAKAEARRRANDKLTNKAVADPAPAAMTAHTSIVDNTQLPVHMVVSVEKPDGTKATIQYKDEANAAAAYRAAKANPANKVYAGYRTVTIRFPGSGLYTYLCDRTVKTKTVNVRTDGGIKTAYVVDNMIRTRRELLEMAQRRGHQTIMDFFTVLEDA